MLPLGALAQRQHECYRPGTMLSRDYVGVSGDSVSNAFNRSGDQNIPSTATLSGVLTTKTFRNYRETHCVTRQHSYQENVCHDVDLDRAIGRGNDNFRSIFNLNVTLLKRAETFAQTVSYGSGRPSAERLDLATNIVKNLTRLAATSAIPRSWTEFSDMLKKVMEEGFITLAEFEDITKVNVEKNKKSLGFTPMDGVTFSEGKGNGKLRRIFDLGNSAQARAGMIKSLLVGINAQTATVFSTSFIDFAGSNGIPETWNQFVLMVKHALTKGLISESVFTAVTATYEKENRRNMGFELSATLCKVETRTQDVNVIETQSSREFIQSVSRNYHVNVYNAPLLSGEKETLTVMFDGLAPVTVNYTNTFNTYRIVSSTMDGDVEKVQLEGARKRVTPNNTIVAQLVRDGKFVNVNLQQPDFNAKVGGRVVVQVKYYEKITLWPDRHVYTDAYLITGPQMMSFKPRVALSKPNRKASAEVSVQIQGSPYYNENFSTVKTVEQ